VALPLATPPRTDVRSWALLSALLGFLPLLQEGKLRHGVIQRTHREQWVGKRNVWVAGRTQGERAGLWGPAEGRLGFNFLMLGITGRADIAVEDSVLEMPHLLVLVRSCSQPVPVPAWPTHQILLPPLSWGKP